MADTKKKKPKPGPQGAPPAPTQSPGSTTAVHFPGTVSPVSLPVGATGPGLPAGINPLIAGGLNTPYWQQQLQQNPSSVLSAYSPPALNQLSQFYSGQNLGGSSMLFNPDIGTFAPAPQGLRPAAGPGGGQGGSPQSPGSPPVIGGPMPGGNPVSPNSPLTPAGPQQGGKGMQGQQAPSGNIPMPGMQGQGGQLLGGMGSNPNWSPMSGKGSQPQGMPMGSQPGRPPQANGYM